MSWISDVNYEISKLNLSKKTLRKFGLSIGIIFAVIGYYLFSNNIESFIYIGLGIIGGILLLLGIVSPTHLQPIYKIWMGLAFAMGWIVSRLLLSLVFVFVLYPIGIIAKIFGKNFLEIKPINKDSFWISREEYNTNYEKLY